jgi:uncharacterized membrane protein YfcA
VGWEEVFYLFLLLEAFFPFNLDFVRGAGLFVALTGALAAGPGLLRRGLADLRLAIPLALIASSSAIVGAMIGLALPKNVVNTLLGLTILGIVFIMWKAKKSEFPKVKEADPIAKALGIGGVYVDKLYAFLSLLQALILLLAASGFLKVGH